jgi:hypothetical protein
MITNLFNLQTPPHFPPHLVVTRSVEEIQSLITCTRCGETGRGDYWLGGGEFLQKHLHCDGPVDMSWVNLAEIGHA